MFLKICPIRFIPRRVSRKVQAKFSRCICWKTSQLSRCFNVWIYIGNLQKEGCREEGYSGKCFSSYLTLGCFGGFLLCWLQLRRKIWVVGTCSLLHTEFAGFSQHSILPFVFYLTFLKLQCSLQPSHRCFLSLIP